MVISSTPKITPVSKEVAQQSFPPDMPPEIRERLMREGKVPSASNIAANTEIPLPTHTPLPTPTSYVTRLDDSYEKDAFVPSRESIYFTGNEPDIKPVILHPVYSQNGIPLNTTIKNLEFHVEKGPFSIRFTVHPKGSPLVSWATITVMDNFQKILYEDGYNRHFSSENVKEFFIYQNGTYSIQIKGEMATMDIMMNTPDGNVQTKKSEQEMNIDDPEKLPPQLRERLMREGRL